MHRRQIELVEDHQRQQHLDGACGWVDLVLVPAGQRLAAVEIGHDPLRIGSRLKHARTRCNGRRACSRNQTHPP